MNSPPRIHESVLPGMVKKMRNTDKQKLVQEILHELKDFQETDFIQELHDSMEDKE